MRFSFSSNSFGFLTFIIRPVCTTGISASEYLRRSNTRADQPRPKLDHIRNPRRKFSRTLHSRLMKSLGSCSLIAFSVVGPSTPSMPTPTTVCAYLIARDEPELTPKSNTTQSVPDSNSLKQHCLAYFV